MNPLTKVTSLTIENINMQAAQKPREDLADTATTVVLVGCPEPLLEQSTRSKPMKRKSTFPPLVILILAAVCVTSTLAAIVPEHGPSASGDGLFRFRNSIGQTEIWTFSFKAIANKNGQTRGRARFDNLTAQTHTVVRINCLSVTSDINSALAVISGTVLHSDDPDLPKLQNVIFAASDGPLLPTSSSDTITPLFPLFPFAGPQNCLEAQPLTILPVEDGDIQIQPSAQTR